MSKKLKQHGIWPVMAILLFISIYSVIQLIADENGASTAEISLITTSESNCDGGGGGDSGDCKKDEDLHPPHTFITSTTTDPECSGSETWEIVGPVDADAVYLIDKKITAYSVKMKTDSDTKIAGKTTVEKICSCGVTDGPPVITTHKFTKPTFTWTVTGCGAEPATGTGEKAEFTPKTTGKGTITFSVLTPPKCDYEESLVATISPASKSFIVPKVEAIKVLAGTKSYAFFKLIPADITGLATFEGKQKQVSGDFGFEFDQTAISGSKTMTVTVEVKNVEVKDSFTANRVKNLVASATEAVSAFFMIEGVGLRLYSHPITESFERIDYSIPASGTTYYLKDSFSTLGTLGDPVTFGESHRYDSIQAGFTPMTAAVGIPPGFSIISNIWAPPVTGIAKTTGIAWFDPNGMVSGLLLNTEVDAAIK